MLIGLNCPLSWGDYCRQSKPDKGLEGKTPLKKWADMGRLLRMKLTGVVDMRRDE
ncbi:hypothetical protein [Nostoc sp. 106C]|uniref:hypothetical protein n=1 Tax=Nostoc sp. 106C TaxID=1932667 RepID=UPI0014130B27|nr:hypothetical protein [Nostoc sp. 106C]